MILALTPVKNKVLADYAGVSESAISRYLSGARVPTAPVAIRIAACLGFEPKDATSLFERVTWEEVVAALIRVNLPGVVR